MESHISTGTIIFSIALGIIAGSLSAAISGRSHLMIKIGVSAILTLLSPIIMRDVWIFGIGQPPTAGIKANLLLLGAFGSATCVFLYRFVMEKVHQKTQGQSI